MIKGVLVLVLLMGICAGSINAQNELRRMTVTPMEAPGTVAVFPDHP
jgi:hypothetical protein